MFQLSSQCVADLAAGNHLQQVNAFGDAFFEDPYREEFLRIVRKLPLPTPCVSQVDADINGKDWHLPETTDIDLLLDESWDWKDIPCNPSIRANHGRHLPATTTRSKTLVLEEASNRIFGGDFNTPDGFLNIKQCVSLLVAACWIQDVLEWSWLEPSTPCPVLSLIIQGGPGTGKTWVCKQCKALSDLFLGPDTTKNLAFTNSVARLIKGVTLHSALSIPLGTFAGKSRTLGDRKDELLHAWKQIKLLWIDEFSMISSQLWYRAELRCKQVKQQSERAWGGLSVITSGDFHQKSPVQSISLAADVALPSQDEDNDDAAMEAYDGRKNWLQFQDCIFLHYSRRCIGHLSTILAEMMEPPGKLSEESWKRLQGAVIGYKYDEDKKRVVQSPTFSCDPRLAAPPFGNMTYVVGVLRHNVRAALAYQQARLRARNVRKMLYICVANDRAEGGASGNRVPAYLYPRFLNVTNPTTTKSLPSLLYLFPGARVILAARICEELGLVRGCACIVDDIIPNALEPASSDNEEDDSDDRVRVFRYTPKAVVLSCPGATWVKDGSLGAGRFLLPPIRRTWSFYLRDEQHIASRVDNRQRPFLSIDRLQFPLSNADVLTDYGLQGETVEGLVLDLKRPPRVSRDEHWLSLLVLLSRATSLDSIAIHRLCKREHLEGGPPTFLVDEIERLREKERTTIVNLHQRLHALGQHRLIEAITQPLLTQLSDLHKTTTGVSSENVSRITTKRKHLPSQEHCLQPAHKKTPAFNSPSVDQVERTGIDMCSRPASIFKSKTRPSEKRSLEENCCTGPTHKNRILEKINTVSSVEHAVSAGQKVLWRPPLHASAPLLMQLSEAFAATPHWYNSSQTAAVDENRIQTESSCGLHAVNHLLASAASSQKQNRLPLSTHQLEAIAMSAAIGDTQANLFQIGSKNYDVAVLHACLDHVGCFLFPLTPADLEGSAGTSSIVRGGRLLAPFESYIIAEGAFSCIGYLLRVPSYGGHWISLLPPVFPEAIESATTAGILCDSMFPIPFAIEQKEIEDLLLAFAITAAAEDFDHSNAAWACFLVGIPRTS